jgi:hypothetical protein
MKKALTIGGAVLGFLLISALVIFIFFPGLPTYIKVKHKYKHIDEKVPAFEAVSAGADFKEYTIKGVKLKAPGDWSVTDNGLQASPEEKVLIVLSTDNKEQDEFLDSMKDYDPWDAYKYNKEDYTEFFRSVDVEPAQYGFSSKIIFYIRDYIDSKDCMSLRGQDKDIFLELADIKEKAVDTETMYKLNGSSFTGYIGRINFSGNDVIWNISIFPDGDDIHEYSVMINYSDETIAKQIISSIELE